MNSDKHLSERLRFVVTPHRATIYFDDAITGSIWRDEFAEYTSGWNVQIDGEVRYQCDDMPTAEEMVFDYYRAKLALDLAA